MTRFARLIIIGLACGLLFVAGCQSPSPDAAGRAQQENNAPISPGDPGVPTHDM